MFSIKFCQKCGGKLAVKEVDGRNRLVCEVCGRVHYQNPIPVVVAVLKKSDERKIGLVKRAIPPQLGKWALPGGFVEVDESPEEAVIREVKEEIGAEGKVQGLIGVQSDDSKLYGKVIVIGYEVVLINDNLLIGNEVQEFKFFPLSDHPPLAFPSHTAILQKFEKTYKNPVPTVDAIVEINGRIVMVKRKNPPYGWALPGGFVDYGESLEEAVVREVKEEINLKVTRLTQFHTYSDPDRDPRFHTITTVFIVKATGSLKAGDDAKNVGVFAPDELPDDIAFDHDRIIKDYLKSKNKQDKLQ